MFAAARVWARFSEAANATMARFSQFSSQGARGAQAFKQLLPTVEDRRLQAMLLAHLRDGRLADQMLPQKGDLFGPTELPSLVRRWILLRLVLPISVRQTAAFSNSD